jgi:hypothetical protein
VYLIAIDGSRTLVGGTDCGPVQIPVMSGDTSPTAMHVAITEYEYVPPVKKESKEARPWYRKLGKHGRY